MKRDFIKGLNIEGLTDEIIDKIMTENAKDIQREQLKAEKSTQEPIFSITVSYIILQNV